jgi:hypothetical protein
VQEGEVCAILIKLQHCIEGGSVVEVHGGHVHVARIANVHNIVIRHCKVINLIQLSKELLGGIELEIGEDIDTCGGVIHCLNVIDLR